MSAPYKRRIPLEEAALQRFLDWHLQKRLGKMTKMEWQRPVSQQPGASPSILTLEATPVVPEDKHVAFEDDKVDSTKQVITEGSRGPVNPMPKRRPQPSADEQPMSSWEAALLLAVAFFAIVGLISSISFVGHWIYDSINEEESWTGNGRVTLSEYQRGYESGLKDGERWSSNAPSSPYNACDKVEASDSDQGRFLFEPSTRTCYFGSQIDAHMAEVRAQEKLEQEQVNKALYELGRLADERGVRADDSWRALAESFAATSPLPMAVEAGRQAFVEHGGDVKDFRPRVAKGGTLSDDQWLKDLSNASCFDRSVPGVTRFDSALCQDSGSNPRGLAPLDYSRVG